MKTPKAKAAAIANQNAQPLPKAKPSQWARFILIEGAAALLIFMTLFAIATVSMGTSSINLERGETQTTITLEHK